MSLEHEAVSFLVKIFERPTSPRFKHAKQTLFVISKGSIGMTAALSQSCYNKPAEIT